MGKYNLTQLNSYFQVTEVKYYVVLHGLMRNAGSRPSVQRCAEVLCCTSLFQFSLLFLKVTTTTIKCSCQIQIEH